MRLTLLAGALVLASASPSRAQNPPSLSVSPYAGVFSFADRTWRAYHRERVRVGALYGLRVGLPIADLWVLEAAYGLAPLDGHSRGPAYDCGFTGPCDAPLVDFFQSFRVQLLYGGVSFRLPLDAAVHPSVSLGVGSLQIDAERTGSMRDLLVTFGAGAGLPLPGDVELRLDVKDHVQFCDAAEPPDAVGDRESACPLADASLHHLEASAGVRAPLFPVSPLASGTIHVIPYAGAFIFADGPWQRFWGERVVAPLDIGPPMIFGARLEATVSGRLGLAATYGFAPLRTLKPISDGICPSCLSPLMAEESGGFAVHVYYGTLNYGIPVSERARPFLSVGLGGIVIRAERGRRSSDVIATFGAGLALRVADEAAVRWEVRDHVQFCEAAPSSLGRSVLLSACPSESTVLHHLEVSTGVRLDVGAFFPTGEDESLPAAGPSR